MNDPLQLDLFSPVESPLSYVTESESLKANLLHKTMGPLSIEAMKAHAQLLSRSEQQALRNWLDCLLEEKIDIDVKIEPPTRSDREIVKMLRVGAIVYQLEKIRCGKCRRCHSGPAHGPYWYSYQRKDGRLKSSYIGIHAPVDLGI